MYYESFPNSQFVLEGYHIPYRLDIANKNDSLIVFVISHIPSRRLTKIKIPSNIQIKDWEGKVASYINLQGCVSG